MSEEKIVGDYSEYYGKHVAIRNLTNSEIIGSGDTPSEAKEEANEKGCQNPIIYYYPHPEEATAFQEA